MCKIGATGGPDTRHKSTLFFSRSFHWVAPALGGGLPEPAQHVKASELRRHFPSKNRCYKQVSSWRHISCHTDRTDTTLDHSQKAEKVCTSVQITTSGLQRHFPVAPAPSTVNLVDTEYFQSKGEDESLERADQVRLCRVEEGAQPGEFHCKEFAAVDADSEIDMFEFAECVT